MLRKSIFVFSCLTFLVFCLTSSYVLANVDKLKRIAEAESDVAYIGLRLKTYSSSRGSRTIEEVVIHRNAKDSYGKVVAIIGAPKPVEEGRRDAERNDRNRNERSRREREFRWEPHRSQFSVKAIELIPQNYVLELRHWGEKIAGHETDLLIIKPKFSGRSSKYIYFSRKNSVILRVEDLDAAGILRDMFVYTRISFDPEVVDSKWDDLRDEIEAQPWHNRPKITLAEAEKILKKAPIQPTFLPSGFQLQGLYKRQFRGVHVQLKYTDGLLDISLFETTNEVRSESTNRSSRGDRNREEATIRIGDTTVREHRRGPDNGFGWRSDDVNFFITGPIPHSELRRVVESIILRKDPK